LALWAFSGGRVCLAARPAAEGIFPNTTLAFLAIYNAPDLKERLASTSLGKMSQDPQLKPLVTQLYGNLANAFAAVETQIGASLDEILSIPQGEFAIGLIPQEGGPPSVAIALDYGNRQAIVDRLLDRAVQALAQTGAERTEEMVGKVKFTIYYFDSETPFQAAWCQYDGTLLASSSVAVLKQVLALAEGGEGETLAGDAEFAAIRERCGSGDGKPVQALAFIDPIALAKNIAAQNAGANVAVTVFVPRLGLDGILGAGGSVSVATEQYDVLTHAHLLLDNPRKAVLQTIAFDQGETAPPAWMTSDAASYVCFHWNFSQTFREVGKIYDGFLGTDAFANLVRGRVGTRLGMDLENELLPALSGRVTFGSVIERPVSLTGSGTIAGLGLKDPVEFQVLLDKLLAAFPGGFEKKTYGRQSYYQMIAPVPRQPGLEGDPQHVSFGIVGEDLVVTDRASLFEKAVITSSDPEKSLASSLEYKLIASKTARLAGKNKLSMLAFNRPEESMRFLYDLAASQQTREGLRARGAGNLQLFKSVDKALTDNPLPPFSVLQQYLAPGGSVLTEDDTGFHYVSFALKREKASE
jgi:hypothetical protein